MPSEVHPIQPEGLAQPAGAYSHACRVEANKFLFVAGQVALDADGNVVGDGDFKEQAKQVYANIRQALAAEGLEMRHIAKFTTYLVRGKDIPAFYEVREELYPELFPGGKYPANTLLVIGRLVREEFLIEIEAVAAYAD
ncbi:MAG: RidA family protein [Anaerolineae bacterium]